MNPKFHAVDKQPFVHHVCKLMLQASDTTSPEKFIIEQEKKPILPGNSFQEKNISIRSDHMNSLIWIPGIGVRVKNLLNIIKVSANKHNLTADRSIVHTQAPL